MPVDGVAAVLWSCLAIAGKPTDEVIGDEAECKHRLLEAPDYGRAAGQPVEAGRGGASAGQHTVEPAIEDVIWALVETIFPAVQHHEVAERLIGNQAAADLLALSAADVGSREAAVAEVLQAMSFLDPDARWQLALLLQALAWRLGTLLLGGRHALTPAFPFVEPFAHLPPAQRERVLQAWGSATLPALRAAFKAVKGLVTSILFTMVDAKGRNPLWPLIAYPGPDPARPLRPLPERQRAERALRRAVLDLGALRCANAEQLTQCLALHDLHVVPGGGPEGEPVCTCDAVVVGSGAGGGVAAALLAEAGLKVVVLEKGRYTPAEQLALLEGEAFRGMYERGGLQATSDAAVSILAGATLGGGTRVNWSASFRTPAHVRAEWATECGLPEVAGPAFDAALDAVCSRLGVCTGIPQHSGPNSVLARGLAALGAHCGEIPRNTGGNPHACGSCGFGCAAGAKRDTTGTFLADAAAAGARILTGVFAQRILRRPTAAPAGERRWEAWGIAAETAPRLAGQPALKFLVRATYVVCSAGTLHTPALLLRSGITCGGQVGRNLRLHPATVVNGVMPGAEGSAAEGVRSWDGAIMSVFSKEVADWEGSGYGALLACPSAHPGMAAAAMPWLGGARFKADAADLPRCSPVVILARDRGAGRVTIGKDGLPRVSYWPGAADRAAMMRGMELGLRALVAAGAARVATLQQWGGHAFTPRRGTDGALANVVEFEAWLADVRRVGLRRNAAAVLSAHQMGTARMGPERRMSVVDPDGVNPMVTIETMAYLIASKLAAHAAAKLTLHMADAAAELLPDRDPGHEPGAGSGGAALKRRAAFCMQR